MTQNIDWFSHISAPTTPEELNQLFSPEGIARAVEKSLQLIRDTHPGNPHIETIINLTEGQKVRLVVEATVYDATHRNRCIELVDDNGIVSGVAYGAIKNVEVI